jgi:CheY-like chemotaxis protein
VGKASGQQQPSHFAGEGGSVPITDLKGFRVLVVEDDSMVSLLLEDMLLELGCAIVGPAPDIDQATAMAQGNDAVDVALLDVNLHGCLVFSVADILSRRQIPFVFATGAGAGGIPENWQGHFSVQKPFTLEQLADAIGSALKERQPS